MSVIEIERYIKSGERCHLVGIGWVSVSALAEVLHGMGVPLSGSDANESSVVDRIRSLGIPVSIGHRAENIRGAGCLIRTAAAREDNVEIKAARESGIPIFERADAWCYIMSGYKNAICIAGVHGKTTTTSMVTHILLAANTDPTVMIGGTLPILGAGHRVGRGDHIVLESCEYYNSFHRFCPTVAVILNVDADHLDFFRDLDDLKDSFRKFASLVPDGGHIVCNGDDENTMEALAPLGRELFTFGFGEFASVSADDGSFRVNEPVVDAATSDESKTPDGSKALTHQNARNASCSQVKPIRVRGINIRHAVQKPSMDILLDNKPLCKITLQMPGKHNLRNALAAVAASLAVGIPIQDIEDGLRSYTGVGRRFEYKGKINGADIYDDYAHHPSELRATLDAVSTLGYKRVILAFQTHTFSRTKALFSDFVTELSRPDLAFLAPIYAAREKDDRTISSGVLANSVAGAHSCGSLQEIADEIAAIARDGDLILTAGAGDIYKVGDVLVKPEAAPACV